MPPATAEETAEEAAEEEAEEAAEEEATEPLRDERLLPPGAATETRASRGKPVGDGGQVSAAASLMAALRGSAAPSLIDSPIEVSDASPQILLPTMPQNAVAAASSGEELEDGGKEQEQVASDEAGSAVAKEMSELAWRSEADVS